jgi:hypothetical protein
MSTAEIQELLASGAAVARYIKNEDAWYYTAAVKPYLDRNVALEWSVGIDSLDGGTHGEWSIHFYNFGSNDGLVHQHRIFADGLAAVLAIPGYLAAMESAGNGPAEVEQALKSLGFVDATPRINPMSPNDDKTRERAEELSRVTGMTITPRNDPSHPEQVSVSVQELDEYVSTYGFPNG